VTQFADVSGQLQVVCTNSVLLSETRRLLQLMFYANYCGDSYWTEFFSQRTNEVSCNDFWMLKFCIYGRLLEINKKHGDNLGLNINKK